MHLRTIVLLFSIGLNFVLGIGWGIYYFNNSVYSRNPIIRNAAAGADRPNKPVAKSPALSKRLNWEKIESDDYSTYIENLRAIGVPESTIHDIIVADVNQHYAERRQQSVQTNQVAWWRSESQTAEHTLAENQANQLENERRGLLSELLGPDWDRSGSNKEPSGATQLYLGGPVLGDLSQPNKQRVQKIAADALDRIQSYAESQRFLGREIDPIYLGRLRQQMRTELSQVLNPAQLEEFLLRYSETANTMRSELRGVEVTPDEFRTIFRIRDPLETELALLGTQTDGPINGRVTILQRQIDNAARQILGPDRYVDYQLNQDPLFVETRAQANSLGLTEDSTVSLFEINRESLAEQQRIRNDTTLTPADRIDELAATEAEQKKALLQVLGPEGFQRWQQLQSN